MPRIAASKYTGGKTRGGRNVVSLSEFGAISCDFNNDDARLGSNELFDNG
jgi:hypothetical protein